MQKPRAFQIPGFAQYCLGQGLSIIGTGMQCVLVPWYVYHQTRSPLALALVAVTTALSLCLLPLGGALADKYRHNRWTILVVSQAIALVQAAALGWMVWADAFNLWVVLGLNFLAGTITAFEFPARQAFKSELVAEELLAVALGFYGAVDFAAFAIGQAIGGVLIVSLSGEATAAKVCFFVNAISYVAALWALIAVRSRNAPKPVEGSPSLSMREGLRLIRSDRLLLALMLQTAIVVLFCKRFDPLLPAFAEDGLKSVEATGWLKMAMVIGAILGGLWMGRNVDKESQLRTSYLAVLALPAFLLVLFMARGPIVASLAVAIVSGLFLIQENCCSASLQCGVPDALRGRIAAWRATVNWGLDLAIGLPLVWAASVGGVRVVLLACAAIGGIVAIALWLCTRELRASSAKPAMSTEPCADMS